AILNRARREAELIAVGKRKGQAGWSQREIEAEMIRRVRAGETVVRLKGGDPFIFGRGGEEVDALCSAGLPVSVVPGITAALGAAAAAGIPLTDRRIASSVTFLSGHAAANSGGGHTHVIYMGATEAASVRDRLLDAGTDPNTPVAIVENGTRPDQRVSVGRLADLTRLALPHTARSDAGPSLIIVGEVAALAGPADGPGLAGGAWWPRAFGGNCGSLPPTACPTVWWFSSTMPASGRRGSIVARSRATSAAPRSCSSAPRRKARTSSTPSWSQWPRMPAARL